MLQPTQLSTIFFMTPVILHAYIRQNDIFFYYWFLVFITSMLWHFKKFTYPRSTWRIQFYNKLDVGAVIVLNLATSYEVFCNIQYTVYYITGICIYMYTIGIYSVGAYTKTLMYHPNPLIAEQYHAMWHFLPTFVSHMFLYIYRNPELQYKAPLLLL